MNTKVLWTPRAREDLLDIYVSIGLDSPAAAERVVSALEERALALSHTPRMGMRRPEIASPARMLVEGRYLILYATRPDTRWRRSRLCVLSMAIAI